MDTDFPKDLYRELLTEQAGVMDQIGRLRRELTMVTVAVTCFAVALSCAIVLQRRGQR